MVRAMERRSSHVLSLRQTGCNIHEVPSIRPHRQHAPSALTHLSLQSTFNHFFSHIYNKLGPCFQTEYPNCQKTVDVRHTLYRARRICDCEESIQIDQYDLRSEAGRIIRICSQSWEILDSPIKLIPSLETTRLITKHEKRCAICGREYAEIFDRPFYARYVPTAPITECFSALLVRSTEGEFNKRKSKVQN